MATSTDFSRVRCSIARSFGVLGDPWKALVVRDLHLGLNRFDLLIEDLGVSRKVLTERLNAMVDDGLIRREPYQERPTRYEYVLTDQGRDFVPVVLAAMAWGDRWLAGDEGAPAIPVHHDHVCETAVVCRTCGEPIQADDVGAAVGPGGQPGPGTELIGFRMDAQLR